MNMKVLKFFLATALVATGFLAAAPEGEQFKGNCRCQNCTCTPENNCGCR